MERPGTLARLRRRSKRVGLRRSFCGILTSFRLTLSPMVAGTCIAARSRGFPIQEALESCNFSTSKVALVYSLLDFQKLGQQSSPYGRQVWIRWWSSDQIHVSKRRNENGPARGTDSPWSEGKEHMSESGPSDQVGTLTNRPFRAYLCKA